MTVDDLILILNKVSADGHGQKLVYSMDSGIYVATEEVRVTTIWEANREKEVLVIEGG